MLYSPVITPRRWESDWQRICKLARGWSELEQRTRRDFPFRTTRISNCSVIVNGQKTTTVSISLSACSTLSIRWSILHPAHSNQHACPCDNQLQCPNLRSHPALCAKGTYHALTGNTRPLKFAGTRRRRPQQWHGGLRNRYTHPAWCDGSGIWFGWQRDGGCWCWGRNGEHRCPWAATSAFIWITKYRLILIVL